MRRVLVTGAAGFIGSHVCRALVEAGAEVVAVVRPATTLERLGEVADRLNLVTADLEDFEPQGPLDACLHLAWYAEPGGYLHDVDRNLRALEASLSLIRGLNQVGCRRLVVAGTCFEPSNPTAPPIATTAVYPRAKQVLHDLLPTTGLIAVCAHIHYLFGPWEDPRRIVPAVITSLLRGEHIAVTGGEQVRELMHVADVATALCAVASSELTGSVDICAGRPATLRTLLELIGDRVGRPELIGFGERPYGPGEEAPITGDPAPLAATGWRARYSLAEAVGDTVDHWKQRLG